MEENKNVEEKKINNNTPSEIPNNQNLISAKKNNGIVIVLVIIVFVLAIVLACVLLFMKDEEGTKKDDDVEVTPAPVLVTPTPTNEPAPTTVPQGDYELTIYKRKDDGTLTSANKLDEYNTEAFKLKVSSKDAKVIEVDYDNLFLIYNDNGIKIYNIKTKTVQDTKLSGNYKFYDIFTNEQKNKILGIGFVDDNYYVGYYNVASEKVLYYNNKYKNDDSPFIRMINDNYFSVSTEEGTYLLNANREKVELSHKYTEDENDWYSYWGEKVGNQTVFVYGFCPDVCIINKLYNDEFKEFYSGTLDEKDYNLYKNALYINAGEVIKKYNANGEIIQTYEGYTDIKGMIQDYVVYLKNDYLVLENLDNPTESQQIMKWNSNYFYDNLLSGYYSREDLDSLDEKNKKEGIYIVIYYDGGGSNKDANGNYGMEYCYNKGQELVQYPIKEEMGGRAKPVLYLYPEKETNVTIKFAHPEYLTTTYPKYINSWNVLAKPNGDLIDKDGKYYYALYWDEKRYNEVDFKEGFYVEGKDAIKFLEEKLTYIGLSDKERNEFIMYWLPIMENNGKNLVYFELTDEREASNKLIIEPKPDSVLRVSIHIKKVNKKINIKEQKLETFKRSGFTAVEWGGMTY